jgi:septal ring factor EnvC (AmiA/AmiB activator)
MTDLCSLPNCANDAGVTIQRQADVEAVPYCLEHGYQREAELKQRLENYRLVTVVAIVPSELELARARVAELEAATTSDGEKAAQVSSVAEQLKTTLDTLETQARALASARAELADRDQALKVMRAEVKRTREELDRVRQQRDEVAGEYAAAIKAAAPTTAAAAVESEVGPLPLGSNLAAEQDTAEPTTQPDPATTDQQ